MKSVIVHMDGAEHTRLTRLARAQGIAPTEVNLRELAARLLANAVTQQLDFAERFARARARAAYGAID